MYKYFLVTILSIIIFVACSQKNHSTQDDGTRLLLKENDLNSGPHHTNHLKIFGKYVKGYNRAILLGIDKVQASVDSGGGYFIGIKAVPTESPVGYPLQFLGKNLLDPPRSTSYCSGSSFAAFIEGMNILLTGQKSKLDDIHAEALRMQEPDGGRREDHIKFWGKWNADGYGNHFALVQYSKMAKVIKPIQARPGDFMNISWKNGGGHSVIFLGWYQGADGQKQLAFWSSQKGTNGFGDLVVPIDRIAEVMVVRLINPQNIFTFDPKTQVDPKVSGDKINW